MKKLITIMFLLIFTYSYSQVIKKVELTDEEIEYLAVDLNKNIFGLKPGTLSNSVKNNLINYSYEIIYKDKVIYRGVIGKPSIAQPSTYFNRNSAYFCLDYAILDADTKLALIEDRRFKTRESENGNKYIYTEKFELFKKTTQGVVVYDEITEQMHVKFYKYVESE